MILTETSPLPHQHIQKENFSKIPKCQNHFCMAFMSLYDAYKTSSCQAPPWFFPVVKHDIAMWGAAILPYLRS